MSYTKVMSMSTVDPDLALTTALTTSGHEARLVVLEAAPIHSLWICGQIQLLVQHDLQVIVLDVVRDLFAAHQDCRKGVEVSTFLAENSPPISYVPAYPWSLDAHSRKQGPRSRDLALAVVDFLSEEPRFPALRQDDKTSFLLVGDKEQWRMLNKGSKDVLIDTRDLIHAAEQAQILPSASETLQKVSLLGEARDWR
jgi:hypothetical protein